MMYENKQLLAVEGIGYTDMGIKILPFFQYNEFTANTDLLTDFMKFFRTHYSILLGRVEKDPNRLGCANWWWNRFVCSRSGRPMRLTKSYMLSKYGDVSKIQNFERLRALEQFSTYPGLADRTKTKLDEGIIFTCHEAPFDATYMAANPSDIDGIRVKGICLDMMLKSLRETYESIVNKHNWTNVEDLLNAYQKDFPGFTFFKAGMNCVEQTLAHLDSAGYYIARVLDRNRDKISGAMNVKEDYVCSFDFRDKLEKKYGKERLTHYFDEILVSRAHANEIKMCYFM